MKGVQEEASSIMHTVSELWSCMPAICDKYRETRLWVDLHDELCKVKGIKDNDFSSPQTSVSVCFRGVRCAPLGVL